MYNNNVNNCQQSETPWMEQLIDDVTLRESSKSSGLSSHTALMIVESKLPATSIKEECGRYVGTHKTHTAPPTKEVLRLLSRFFYYPPRSHMRSFYDYAGRTEQNQPRIQPRASN